MPPQVQLLGSARILDPELRLSATKGNLLLCYLAYQQDWVGRDEIGFLFWADAPSDRGRHNLRQILKRLRRHAWLEALETNVDRLRWRVETDVAELRRALAERRWDAVYRLYTGALLADQGRGLTVEYEAWLEHERSDLQSAWRDALFRYAEELERAGRLDEAGAVCLALLERDALDEAALGRYLQMAARAGNRERALNTYARFEERLRAELDLEPTSHLRQLADALHTLPAGTPPLAPSSDDAPPMPSTTSSLAHGTFIGRELDLAEISYLLAKPDGRLVTLSGLGGVGKTRTAVHVMQELRQRYADGAAFVGLESVTQGTAIVNAIATALDVPLRGQGSALEQIVRHLQNKHMLLVLDNVEHLASEATIVADLLDACADLDILATSRERLMLEREWLLPLAGLRYPRTPVPLEEAHSYDAIRLFVYRARRVRPRFELTLANLPHVQRICRLLEGSPLGLELAAVWVRLMPCADIAAEIDASLDFLASDQRDTRDRHRSLNATFETSWARLTPHEREVLATLSVFRGGFRREAAAQVAGASLAVLGALVDKSLIRVDDEGRYDRHPLLLEYTTAKLARTPDRLAEARARHGRYFHHLLKRWGVALRGNAAQATLPIMDAELENIRAAWRWALETRDAARLRQSAEAVFWYHDARALYHDAPEWFSHVIEALDSDDSEHQAGLGYAYYYRAFVFHRHGYEEALPDGQNALRLFRTVADTEGMAAAHSLLGGQFMRLRRHDEAYDHLNRALDLARRFDDAHLLTRIHTNLGLVAELAGDLHRAADHYREAVRRQRQLENPIGLIFPLSNLGFCLICLEDYATARPLCEEGLALAKAHRMPGMVAAVLADLAYLYDGMGDYERAHAHATAALDAYTDVNLEKMRAQLSYLLAHITLALRRPEEARAHMKRGLALAWELGDTTRTLDALRAAATIRWHRGDRRGAADLMAFIIQRVDSMFHPYCRDRARTFWAKIQERLPQAEVERAAAAAREMRLESVVRGVLAH